MPGEPLVDGDTSTQPTRRPTHITRVPGARGGPSTLEHVAAGRRGIVPGPFGNRVYSHRPSATLQSRIGTRPGVPRHGGNAHSPVVDASHSGSGDGRDHGRMRKTLECGGLETVPFKATLSSRRSVADPQGAGTNGASPGWPWGILRMDFLHRRLRVQAAGIRTREFTKFPPAQNRPLAQAAQYGRGQMAPPTGSVRVLRHGTARWRHHEYRCCPRLSAPTARRRPDGGTAGRARSVMADGECPGGVRVGPSGSTYTGDANRSGPAGWDGAPASSSTLHWKCATPQRRHGAAGALRRRGAG